LVDDHADTARALARALRMAGHIVHTAGTCAEALHAFKLQPGIEVVLLDMNLPDGEGCQLLRDLHALRRVPGIAVSAYGMEQDIARSMAAGFIAHVVKPMVLPRLTEILASIGRIGGAPAGDGPK
jgi:CheY-like chemotaxis protein